MNGKTRFTLIGGICALMIAMGIGRFAYTPLLPLMQADLRFTDAAAGYLASSNYAGYFVGAMLAGVLPLKRRRVFHLRCSLAVSIATTCAMGWVHAWIPMLAIRFVAGLASAFVFVLASGIVLDQLAAAGRTHDAGFFYAGVGLGILLSTLLIPGLSRRFMWEGAWIGLSLLSGMLGMGTWLGIRDDPGGPGQTGDPAAISRGPALNRFPGLVLAYGLEGLGYIVTGTFIVSMAESSGIAFDPSIVWMVVGAGAIPSCILWSAAASRMGMLPSLTLAMILQAAGIALPVIRPGPSGFILGALLFGATFMGITTLATTLARGMNPSGSSRMIGILTAAYAAGQMTGPAVAGWLLTRTGGFQAALLGAAGAVFLGGVILAGGMRSGERNRPGSCGGVKKI